MNLLIFESSRGEILPVVETVSVTEPAVGEDSGRWGRIKRQTHRTYRNLKEKLPYYENLCSQLREARSLQVYHSSSWQSDDCPQQLRNFLTFRDGKHSRWLWIHAVLAFLGIFLMPLPGPNIFFFYPAARTFGHYLARKGARHLLGMQTVSFQSDPLIDLVQSNIENLEKVRTELTQLEERYHIEKLEKILSAIR
jgi:hypothetical protein